MLKSLRNRRSIRAYADRDIPEDLLGELLEVAARASNTGNMQLYSVVMTRDKAGKERLAPAHFNQPMVTTAPVVLTFCADANRFVKWAACREAEAGFDNMQTFITSAIDAILFAQTFCVAAEERGLGICYLGTTSYNADQIIEALDLPRLVVPITTVTVGWPAEPRYRDYTPADIDRLYAEKEALPENEEFVRVNNKRTLAQVFTDIRYTKANNEHFSEVLLDVLRRQGFLR